MWTRSAYWVGRAKPQAEARFGTLVNAVLVPAIAALPGVSGARALRPMLGELIDPEQLTKTQAEYEIARRIPSFGSERLSSQRIGQQSNPRCRSDSGQRIRHVEPTGPSLALTHPRALNSRRTILPVAVIGSAST